MKPAPAFPSRTDWLMNLGLALLLLPVVGALFVHYNIGLSLVVRGWLHGASPLRSPLMLLTISIYGWALLRVLRRGHLILAPGLILLASLLQVCAPIDKALFSGNPSQFKVKPYVSYTFQKKTNRTRDYDVAGPIYHTANFSVACNGADLGSTSDAIALPDFLARVQPVSAPPRQALIWKFLLKPSADAITSQTLRDFHGLGLSGLPFDPRREIKRNTNWWNLGPIATSNFLEGQPYWWTFRLRGATAVGSPNDVESHAPWRERPKSIVPFLWFPQRERHADALLATLRAEGGPPSTAWRRHALAYGEYLVPELCWRAQRDPECRVLVETLAREKYGFEGKLDAAAYAGILDRILEHIRREGRFAVPSLESAALDQFPPEAADVVGRAWLKASAARRGLWGRFVTDNTTKVDGQVWHSYTADSFEPGAFPLAVLDYALVRLHPDIVFNRLVYETGATPAAYQDTRLLILLGQYRRRPEAAAIVRRRLREWAEQKDTFALSRIGEVAQGVANPALEEDFQNAIERLAAPTDPFAAESFARARIGRAGVDQDRLAQWIERTPALKERDKIQLLRDIEAPRISEILERVVGTQQGPALQDFFWSYRPRRPNPYLEPFLRRVFEKCRTRLKMGLGPVDDSQTRDSAENALSLLLGLDTPDARSDLMRLWESGLEGKRWVLQGLAQDRHWDWELPHVKEWIQWISELRDTDLDYVSCGALYWIGNREAYELLESWANGHASAKLAGHARTRLEYWNKQEIIKVPPSAAEVARREAELRRQGAELIAGKIQPDDLMGARRGWVWREGRYVREQPQ